MHHKNSSYLRYSNHQENYSKNFEEIKQMDCSKLIHLYLEMPFSLSKADLAWILKPKPLLKILTLHTKGEIGLYKLLSEAYWPKLTSLNLCII